MKKKTIFISVLVLILSIIGFLIFQFVKNENIYSNIIKSNWKIELPTEYNEIYSSDSGDSFLGDGQRYHIFEYKDNTNIIKSLNWQEDKNISVELNILKILSDLDISSEFLPDFKYDYKYFFQVEPDLSEIYIVFFENLKKVYIIESFK
ncbi:TPA: hypothetical protein I9007_002440 [Clostridium perfringens]|uniref:hypothetical protein n=1 Tax=Clostridium perfringens TaxID=1502 RepID=UPI001A323785|nr:hypothetical protein [Clostridium perfringens]UBK72714.1 hypothetical protein KLF32_13910 [Clostridium perfringens]HAT4186842.1 hypothetical protein [Clostridium perfringens]HAT4189439.1 hypothetical protein [Clostridium perfringens]HAT4194706.1 hypothetical protein [Clostridium perfringens]HAT4197157.1 hypothetical protein [Clostridium perfringens]